MKYRIIQNNKTKLFYIQSKSAFGFVSLAEDTKGWTIYFNSKKLAQEFIAVQRKKDSKARRQN